MCQKHPQHSLETPGPSPRDSEAVAPLSLLTQLSSHWQTPQQHHCHVKAWLMAPRVLGTPMRIQTLPVGGHTSPASTERQHSGVTKGQVPISVRKRDKETSP